MTTTKTTARLSNQRRQMADDVARRTDDAYSFPSYSESGWRECCRMLAGRGYNEYEIEAIMRSKWTRWAGDMDSGRLQYGQFNSVTLASFIDKQIVQRGERRVQAEVAELVRSTFEA